MSPQERDVLLPLLDRLRQTRVPVKDAEADQLIRQTVQAQPDAPYVLAQTVLMQDYALHAAEARMRALEQQLEQARQQAQQQAQHGSGGGFLSGLLGGGRPAPAPPPYVAPSYVAPSYGTQIASAVQPGMGGGSSFLRGAAQAAAGVAGGMLLAQGIEDLFGGHHGGLGGGMGSGFMGDALGGFGPGSAEGFAGGPASVDQFVEHAPDSYAAGGYDAAPASDDPNALLGGDAGYGDAGDAGYADDAGGGDGLADDGFVDDSFNS